MSGFMQRRSFMRPRQLLWLPAGGCFKSISRLKSFPVALNGLASKDCFPPQNCSSTFLFRGGERQWSERDNLVDNLFGDLQC